MQDTLEYIEAYFTQTLSSEERKNFEVRCAQDEAFAKEVAFYLTARSAAHELLMEQKEKTDTVYTAAEKQTTATGKVKTMPSRKWMSYIAAACVIFIVAAIFFLHSPTPNQLAANYIHEKYVEKKIGVTMNASRDSMQLGIDAYNKQDYNRAIQLFEGVRRSNPEISDAKKYAGLAYLQIKNYDKALERFEELAAMPGLSNSGDILAAATLLQRNKGGDKERAKALLQKVVQEEEEGSAQAKEWLENW